ncbi:XkdX family protein [Clostridioides mangenotii]|nr:XkdX family protein [Clostridioides mangenotii]
MFYEASLRSIGMVWNAVGCWITADEFQEITGIEFKEN